MRLFKMIQVVLVLVVALAGTRRLIDHAYVSENTTQITYNARPGLIALLGIC